MATPNMNLVLPIPHVTSGTWGDMLNTAFSDIDTHDHSTGRGVDVLRPTQINLAFGGSITLYSPNNTRWRITIDNAGNLVTALA